MASKIYLVYDFEELCGVFTDLELAKKAVAEHLGLIKHYSKSKAKKMGFGEIDFEVYERAANKSWVYALLVKTKKDNRDLHRRKIAIYELNLNEYNSLLKKFVENSEKGILLKSQKDSATKMEKEDETKLLGKGKKR